MNAAQFFKQGKASGFETADLADLLAKLKKEGLDRLGSFSELIELARLKETTRRTKRKTVIRLKARGTPAGGTDPGAPIADAIDVCDGVALSDLFVAVGDLVDGVKKEDVAGRSMSEFMGIE